MTPRPIALLTDFGHRDPFVGICHGVILKQDPTIPIIDVVHGIPHHDVRAGALALLDAAPFMPEETIFVGVVDPGVGSDRRALAVECADGSIFIGPDNGLLVPAIVNRGGATAAFEISDSPWRLSPVSGTFHARDIFVPVAAKLAVGAPLVEAGVAIDHDKFVELPVPSVEWSGDAVATTVLAVDDFGNVRLAGRFSDLGNVFRGDRVELITNDRKLPAVAAAAYSDGTNGGLLLIEDSTGSLTIAVNRGDAARALSVSTGDRLHIRRS